jgi:hypothetical protein
MQEHYADRLERECKEIDHQQPEIKEIITEVLRINNLSSFDFDYKIERTKMMYDAVKNILEKSKAK